MSSKKLLCVEQNPYLLVSPELQRALGRGFNLSASVFGRQKHTKMGETNDDWDAPQFYSKSPLLRMYDRVALEFYETRRGGRRSAVTRAVQTSRDPSSGQYADEISERQ